MRLTTQVCPASFTLASPAGAIYGAKLTSICLYVVVNNQRNFSLLLRHITARLLRSPLPGMDLQERPSKQPQPPGFRFFAQATSLPEARWTAHSGKEKSSSRKQDAVTRLSSRNVTAVPLGLGGNTIKL